MELATITFHWSPNRLWFHRSRSCWWLRKPNKLAFTTQCVLLVVELLCSTTKLTFVLTLWAWCVFPVFGCALSVYHLSSHWVRVCFHRIYVIEHIVNSKWFQISTSWNKVLNTRQHQFAGETNIVLKSRELKIISTEFRNISPINKDGDSLHKIRYTDWTE